MGLLGVLAMGVLNASVIIGFYKLTSDNHLLFFIRSFFESIVYRQYKSKYLSAFLEFIYRPVLGCVICMNSVYGVIMFFVYLHLEVIRLETFYPSSVTAYGLSVFVSITITSFYENNISHRE